LPEKDRQIFIDAAVEAGIWFRPMTGLQAEIAARKVLEEKHGVKYVELDQAELSALFSPMVDEYAKERGIYDYVVKVRKELNK
jgi:TRAP-type C4-dicarboxylate transport system substrate-binding protein